MSGIDLCVFRSRNLAGEVVVRLGVVLLDEYLDFLAGRCRANTVLAAAYDLKVFFTVVAKPVVEVSVGDVFAFMTAQRTGVSTPVENWFWRTLCDGFVGCVRRGGVLVGLVVARIGSVILLSHLFPI